MRSSLKDVLTNAKHKHPLDHLANVNSGISAIALYPQLADLLNGKSSTGLSPLSFILIAASSSIWFLYGIHRRTPPLIISSFFNGAAAFGIVIMIFLR